MRRLVLPMVLAALPWMGAAQQIAGMGPEAPPDGAPEVAQLRILEATGLDPAAFLWTARILAVMANSPNDPAFIQQMREIAAGADRLVERDVVVITDTDHGANSPLRRMLRPRGFMLAIIEKDGAIAQRRPAPRDAREIAAIIDRFPLRRQEMLERLPAGN